MLPLALNPRAGGNAHPLAKHPQRNRDQTKQPHEHAEDAKRLRRSPVMHPLGHEESPGKGDDGAQDGDHRKAVSGQVSVRVDELCIIMSVTSLPPPPKDTSLT